MVNDSAMTVQNRAVLNGSRMYRCAKKETEILRWSKIKTYHALVDQLTSSQGIVVCCSSTQPLALSSVSIDPSTFCSVPRRLLPPSNSYGWNLFNKNDPLYSALPHSKIMVEIF